MEISFKGPVMPIDPYSQLAFVEILNIILIAKHIMDVNRRKDIYRLGSCQRLPDTIGNVKEST